MSPVLLYPVNRPSLPRVIEREMHTRCCLCLTFTSVPSPISLIIFHHTAPTNIKCEIKIEIALGARAGALPRYRGNVTTS